MNNQRGLRTNLLLYEDIADTNAIIQKAMHNSESSSATFKDCLQDEINKKKTVYLIQPGDTFYVTKQAWEEMGINRSQFVIIRTIKQRNIPISWFERLKFWKWIKKEIAGYLVEFIGKFQETSPIYEVSTAFESLSRACNQAVESMETVCETLKTK